MKFSLRHSLRHFTLFIVSAAVIISIYSCSDKPSKQNQSKSDSNFGSVIALNTTTIDSSLFNKGEAMFKTVCKTCHARKGSGHDYLEGVIERVGVHYLKLYLTKQDSLVASKDSIALRVKEVWNNLPISHNFRYNSKELDEIIEYLK